MMTDPRETLKVVKTSFNSGTSEDGKHNRRRAADQLTQWARRKHVKVFHLVEAVSRGVGRRIGVQ